MTFTDPTWAWQPYEPTDERPWNRTMAAHLYRRAGFAATSAELDAAVKLTPGEVVDQMLAASDAEHPFQQESDDFANTILAGGDPRQLSAWWAYTMLRTPAPLLEKTTLFWHGHFATSADKVQDAEAMYEQNRLLRRHALGDFAKMVHAISRDPAMLVYLDSVTNRKAHPNENYARELMELFCLGEGNYTEQDVQQLARCFTGWEIRRGKFRFNRYQHDTGEKTILGKTDQFPEAAAVDLVLEQPSAPRFIVSKLIKYFVFDEPEPDAEVVTLLADEMREHDLDIGHVVRRILTSQLFFSKQAIGRKVRSPVELVVGLMRSLEGSANAQELANELVDIGQGLFYPPNVKGWDGGRTWINSSTLLGRANIVGRLVRDEKTRFGGTDLEAYFARDDITQPAAIVERLSELLLAVPLSGEASQRLVGLLEDSGDRSESIAEVIHVLSTLPEFQLC